MTVFWLTGIFLSAAAADSSILFHTSATKRVLISFGLREREKKPLITLHFIHWRDLYPLHKSLIGHFIMFCHPERDPASPLRLIPPRRKVKRHKGRVITASACWRGTQREHEVWTALKTPSGAASVSGVPLLKGSRQEAVIEFIPRRRHIIIIYCLMGPQGALDHIVTVLAANKRTLRTLFWFHAIE